MLEQTVDEYLIHKGYLCPAENGAGVDSHRSSSARPLIERVEGTAERHHPGRPTGRLCVTRGYDPDRLRAVRLERVFRVVNRNHRGTPLAERFVFPSPFTGDGCVAIFERAFGRLWATGMAELIRHAEFLAALDDYDIVLIRPPGRPKRWVPSN